MDTGQHWNYEDLACSWPARNGTDRTSAIELGPKAAVEYSEPYGYCCATN
jgi:hypothetical protein